MMDKIQNLPQVKETAPDQLSDILNVEIRGETAVQRLESCPAQVGSPYCFLVGDTPVRISFQSCGETLEQKIKSYFLGLKN